MTKALEDYRAYKEAEEKFFSETKQQMSQIRNALIRINQEKSNFEHQYKHFLNGDVLNISDDLFFSVKNCDRIIRTISYKQKQKKQK